jgi:hypothetical protein
MAAIDVAIETTPVQEPAHAERPYNMLETINAWNGFRTSTAEKEEVKPYEDIRSKVARITETPEYDMRLAIESPVEAETVEPEKDISEHFEELFAEKSKERFGLATRSVFSAKKTAIRGLVKAAKFIKSASADTVEAISNKSRNLSARSFKHAGNFMYRVSDIEFSPRQKKAAVAIGGLAVAAITVYAAHRLGVHIGGFNTVDHNNITHDPIKSINTVHDAVAPAKEAVKPHAQKSAASVTRAALTAHQAAHLKDTVDIDNGEGYTQVLQKLYPNHDPQTYLNAYKLMIKEHGPDFIKGIHHYRMADGDWGLSGPGPAHVTSPVAQELAKYFSAH